MRVMWRGLELPTSVEQDQLVKTEKYGKFYVEPFERGFGTTVGNSLRRVLLSSLEGSAVTSIKIAGVDHEFTSIKGIMEDVTEIVLNIKSLIVRLDSDEPKIMNLSVTKAGVATAADIIADPSIEIINPNQIIATLTENVKLDVEFVVEKGRGYVTATEVITENAGNDQEIGVIVLDAVYSPVTRVRYKTEDTRVGQKTNYDKLIMEIWTDGSITPELALVEASKILRKHITPFVQYSEIGTDTIDDSIVEEQAEVSDVDDELVRKMNMPVQELELSVRAGNCLDSAKIETIGELIVFPESQLLKIRSFGKTSLREIRRKLADIGLSLGMDV